MAEEKPNEEYSPENPVSEDSPYMQRNATGGRHSATGPADELPGEGELLHPESEKDEKAKAAAVSPSYLQYLDPPEDPATPGAHAQGHPKTDDVKSPQPSYAGYLDPTEECEGAQINRSATNEKAPANSSVAATVPGAHAHGPDAGLDIFREVAHSDEEKNSSQAAALSHPSYIRYLDAGEGSATPGAHPHDHPKTDVDKKDTKSSNPTAVSRPSYIPYLEDSAETQEETKCADPPPSLVRGNALVAETEPGAVAHGRQTDILDDSPPSSNRSFGSSLVEALPVTEADLSARHDMMEAQLVDYQDLARQESNLQANEAREKRRQRLAIAFGLIVIGAGLALVLALSFGLKSPKEEETIRMEQNTTPTESPTTSVFLPPMENLELLYENLPDKTQESLQNSSTPQYTAWEWLLNHPNVTNLEEWRKQQVYAMATFYYSFHGPTWREGSQGDFWMNQTANECDWALNKRGNLASASYGGEAGIRGTRNPCNDHGELRFLGLLQLLFPKGNFQPSMPPEIGLLTSLQALQIAFSRLRLKLSDLLVPELVQLPKLMTLNLAGIGLSGTIPKRIGQMSSLMNFALAFGDLTGTIPTEIAKLTKLDYFTTFDNALTGTMPSELGLMTSLGRLLLSRNFLTGAIPTQLGQLSAIRRLTLSTNELTGSIPSELGLLAKVTDIRLGNNDLSGSIPLEFWRFSSLEMLHLQNLPNLHGRVPSDVDLPQLKSLDLSGLAHLSGTLPEHFWQFSHLESLLLPGLPNLHGRIPSSIFMPNLTSVDLRGSSLLSGTLPEHICSILKGQFDCTGLLCGCGCPCAETTNQSASLLNGNQSMP